LPDSLAGTEAAISMATLNAQLAQELRGKIKGIVRADEPMSKHTSFVIGGPADIFAEPADIDDISLLLHEADRLGLPWTAVGDGQNLLVADRGIRGIVIRLGKPMSYIRVDGNLVVAGAGAKLTKTMDVSIRHSLAGLEGCTGVPGTVGGGIVMNAGTRYGFVGDVTKNVTVVESNGMVRVLTPEDIQFGYRSSGLEGRKLIVAEAQFELRPGNQQELTSTVQRLKRRRSQTQPTAVKSAGCVFRNPGEEHASRMIDEAGAKGLRIGDAEVSEKHANYLINAGGATASQIRELGDKVRQMVRDRFGVLLEYEVKMIGDWEDSE
jgi:UDP-N-acetylmuramate dehydrogenase